MGCCTASGSTWSFLSSRSRWVRGSVVSGTAPRFTITDMALREVVPPAAVVTALIAGWPGTTEPTDQTAAN